MARWFQRMSEEDRRFLLILCPSPTVLWVVTNPGGIHTCLLCRKEVITLRPTSRRRRVHLERVKEIHLAKHVEQFPPRIRAAVSAAVSIGAGETSAVEQVLGMCSMVEIIEFMRSGKVFGQEELFR
jgi:hypothetical protein